MYSMIFRFLYFLFWLWYFYRLEIFGMRKGDGGKMTETSADELVLMLLDQSFDALHWPEFLQELQAAKEKAGS